MSLDTRTPAAWQLELPRLSTGRVTLREPAAHDLRPLVDLLSVADASRFGLDEVSTLGVLTWIDRVVRQRRAGVSFAFVVTQDPSPTPIGLIQVRQLDAAFTAAECEGTLLPSVRGTGVFVDAARLLEAFVFETVGAHRVEVRAPLHSGRVTGALRKLGAVEEGVLRRSARHGAEYVDQMLWSLLKEDWRGAIGEGARVH